MIFTFSSLINKESTKLRILAAQKILSSVLWQHRNKKKSCILQQRKHNGQYFGSTERTELWQRRKHKAPYFGSTKEEQSILAAQKHLIGSTQRTKTHKAHKSTQTCVLAGVAVQLQLLCGDEKESLCGSLSRLCVLLVTDHSGSGVHCALYIVHATLCTLHSALYTVHSTLCTLHCALYTLHSTLCTLHCAHSSALCNVPRALFTRLCVSWKMHNLFLHYAR